MTSIPAPGAAVRPQDDEIVHWRHGVLDTTLRVATWFGLAACIPSAYMAATTGLPSIAILDVCMLAIVVVLHRAKHIPYVWRAAIFAGVGYSLGLGLLVTVGSYSQIFFLAAAVGATLLLGRRAGLIATFAGAATLAVIGFMGLSGPEVILVTKQYYGTRWLVISLNYTLLSTLLSVGIGTVLAQLEEALGRVIRDRRALEEERTLLRTFIDTLPDIVFTKDTMGRFVMVNPAAVRMSGFASEQEMCGKTVFDIYPRAMAERFHEDDMAVMAGRDIVNREVPRYARTGDESWYLTLKSPLRDSTGAITGLLGISRDITERKKLEEQLQQSQKMEAVGQLAGGVAHDFNNLLTIIFGYSEVLRAQTQRYREIREPVEAISDAASRAADLTRQLLAFSRQTMLQPKVLDLNATITGTGRMLRRLIGENIQFSLVLDPAIARVRVDPGQFDQVLLNLAVNARDAMPTGGMLSIATQRAELSPATAAALETSPGSHVMVTVRDTGVGMSPEIAARIFEPFFTTKGIGNGTGLGLAMVFGIVRQSGGAITVSSEVGQGTAFSIYLPVASTTAGRMVDVASTTGIGGDETILLVEDDIGVRDLAEANLRSCGYDVVCAADGREALTIVTSGRDAVDLIITDVVMPHLSGPQLAASVREVQPDMRVLFMSGYTDDAVLRQGLLKDEVSFLQKPYTPDGLVLKVRQVLDAGRITAVV